VRSGTGAAGPCSAISAFTIDHAFSSPSLFTCPTPLHFRSRAAFIAHAVLPSPVRRPSARHAARRRYISATRRNNRVRFHLSRLRQKTTPSPRLTTTPTPLPLSRYTIVSLICHAVTMFRLIRH